MNEQIKNKELLVQWLEDFKTKAGEYDEAIPTIEECENALTLYKNIVDKIRIPLLVQNLRNARRADNSCLEYGLEYHLRGLKSAVNNYFVSQILININENYSLKKVFQEILDSLREITIGLTNK